MGCMTPQACDFDPNATIAGSCEDYSSCLGCMDSDADNYDAEATQDSGNCLYSGCTIPVACNYNPQANTDDDSCEYTSCAGCLNSEACNYDEEAIIAGDCTFPESGYNCDGNCINDADGDLICDEFEIGGVLSEIFVI